MPSTSEGAIVNQAYKKTGLQLEMVKWQLDLRYLVKFLTEANLSSVAQLEEGQPFCQYLHPVVREELDI